MHRQLVIAAAAATVLTAGSARAQGAFNMGSLTQTLSQDAVTQSEAKKAGKPRRSKADATYRARLAELCPMRQQYKATEGDTEDYREVDRACRAEGL